MKIVGYYQACERVDDASLAPIGERVASKIKAGFDDAVAFVVRALVSSSSSTLAYTIMVPFL